MLPDRVSNPRPLTYKSSALPIALRGAAHFRNLTREGTVDMIRNYHYFPKGGKNLQCCNADKIINGII